MNAFFNQMTLQLTNVHFYKNLKIVSCKHFELVDYPVEECSEFCLVLWALEAVGQGGGPWQCKSLTHVTVSLRLSSGT